MNSRDLALKISEQLKQLGNVSIVNDIVTNDSTVEHVIDIDMIVDRTVFNVSVTVIFMQQE